MIVSLSLSKAEFAAQRRAAQDRLVERLSGVVGAFLSTGAISDLKAALTNALREEFKADSDRALRIKDINLFLTRVEKALQKANRDSDVHVTALALSLAVLNEAAMLAASYEDGSIVLEWVTMHDNKVREAHQDVDGEQRPVGETFDVDGVAMRAPGDMTAPIELWINCRCVLRPAGLNEEATMASVRTEQNAKIDALHGPGAAAAIEKAYADGSIFSESLTAAPDITDDTVTIMAIPADDQPVHELSMEEAHATIVYFGDLPRTDESDDGAIDAIKAWTAEVAADAQPFTAPVSGIDQLGPEDAPALVWLLGESDLNGIHEGIMSDTMVRQTYEDADTTKYPEYTPHVTIGYDVPLSGDGVEALSGVTEITFDRLAVWHGSERTEYPLGEAMVAAAPAPEVDEEVDAPAEDDEFITPPDAEAPPEPVDDRIPWHGSLAPEGVRSGDGRMFTNLGRTRDLPMPLTWQKISDDGHKSNVTVAMIEWAEMRDGEMRSGGHFLSSAEEADEVIGLISEFGRFGVSVDADDIGSASYDEAEELEVYDDPRVSAACIVAIPAFATGAWVALGPDPEHDADQANGDVIEPAEGVDIDEQIEDAEPEEVAASGIPLLKLAGVPDSFKNAAIAMHEAEQAAIAAEQAEAEEWASIEQFKDLAPGKTEDGPGWLTHPVDTDRLRDYWVRGPGAAKIGWGSPGDFNRCRVNVAEYVKPQYLNGYCANRHYDALGFWPGRPVALDEGPTFAQVAAERIAEDKPMPEGISLEPAPTLSFVASGAGWAAPSEFFMEPTECDPDDGVVIEAPNEDGLMRTYGYVAEWGVCHIGYDGMCKEAPPSASNYAYFRTGHVNTPDGPVKTGVLTAGTGHANPRIGAMPAAAHYDNTGSVWAMVTTGENERGIWFSGLVKPGTPAELLNDVAASGRISGDWRPIGNDLELVAGLTVNVPGFPIIPTEAAVTTIEGERRQLSLVAAGVPRPKTSEAETDTIVVADLEPSTLTMIASMVVDEMEARKVRQARFDAIKEKVDH